MALRSTPYADELVSAEGGGGRIGRLRIRDTGGEEIRFSRWADGSFSLSRWTSRKTNSSPSSKRPFRKACSAMASSTSWVSFFRRGTTTGPTRLSGRVRGGSEGTRERLSV